MATSWTPNPPAIATAITRRRRERRRRAGRPSRTTRRARRARRRSRGSRTERPGRARRRRRARGRTITTRATSAGVRGCKRKQPSTNQARRASPSAGRTTGAGAAGAVIGEPCHDRNVTRARHTGALRKIRNAPFEHGVTNRPSSPLPGALRTVRRSRLCALRSMRRHSFVRALRSERDHDEHDEMRHVRDAVRPAGRPWTAAGVLLGRLPAACLPCPWRPVERDAEGVGELEGSTGRARSVGTGGSTQGARPAAEAARARPGSRAARRSRVVPAPGRRR